MLSKLSQAENITEGETTGSDFLGYITSRRNIYTCLWIMWEPRLPMPFQMTLLGLKHQESHLTWALNVRKWEWAGPKRKTTAVLFRVPAPLGVPGASTQA